MKVDVVLQLYGGFSAIALFRMSLAFVCGTIVGWHRQLRGHTVAAGFTTFCLVCVGATLAMTANEYIARSVAGTGDSARIAAQVISGIGFLGAGTIVTSGPNKIRGLATAASLWVTAAIGITIGTGFYAGAVQAVILVLLSNVVCSGMQTIFNRNSRVLRIQIECEYEAVVPAFLSYAKRRNIRIKAVSRHDENTWYRSDICFLLEMDLLYRRDHARILSDIGDIDGVRYVAEI